MRNLVSSASCKTKAFFSAVLVATSAIGAFPYSASTQQSIVPGRPPCDGPNFPGPHFSVGGSPIAVATDDLDGDGDEDLAVGHEGVSSVSILMNQGNGTFAPHVTYATGVYPSSIAIDDLDGDGDKDLAATSMSWEGISVLRNEGSGTFAAAELFWTGTAPISVAIGDLDGDGYEDLAFANYVSPYTGLPTNSVGVLLNQGDGTFSSYVAYWTGTSPRSVAIDDLDGDGNLDLAVANYGPDNVSVLLGRCP